MTTTPDAGDIEQLDGLFRMRWTAGPNGGARRPCVASVTEFSYGTTADLAGFTEEALGLRRTWPVMEGAVGLWLWADPPNLRGGSITVWREPEDLRRFVDWAVHREIVERWRDRGRVRSALWRVTWEEDLPALWDAAAARIVAWEPAPAPQCP